MSDVSKRQFTRINFTREVMLDFQGTSYSPCRIKDLSLGGMYVFSGIAESDGACCDLAFKQTGPSSDLVIRATARVVRKDKDGIAIEFTSMAYDSYMLLQMILLYEAKDPLTVSLEYPTICPFEIRDTSPQESY